MSEDKFAINPPLLHILRHSIGLDDSGNGREYRNHYATDPESEGGKRCQELCAAGLMQDYGPQSMWGGLHGYAVTEEGRAVVRLYKPPEKRMTQGRRRYLDFLAADSGMRFGEWLKAQGARRRTQQISP